MTFPRAAALVLTLGVLATQNRAVADPPRTLQEPRRWFAEAPMWAAALPPGRVAVLEESWRKYGQRMRHCFLRATEVTDGADATRRVEAMLVRRGFQVNHDSDGGLSTQADSVLGEFRIIAGPPMLAEISACVEDTTSDNARLQHAVQGDPKLVPVARFAAETAAVFAYGKRRSSVGEGTSAELVFVVEAAQSLAAHRWLEAHRFHSTTENAWQSEHLSVVEDTEREEMAFSAR